MGVAVLDSATPRPVGVALLMVYSSPKKTELGFTRYSQPLFSHLQNVPELRIVTHAYNPRTLEVGCRRITRIAQLVNCLPCKYEESSLKPRHQHLL